MRRCKNNADEDGTHYDNDGAERRTRTSFDCNANMVMRWMTTMLTMTMITMRQADDVGIMIMMIMMGMHDGDEDDEW